MYLGLEHARRIAKLKSPSNVAVLEASDIDRTTKQFTAEEFGKVLRSSNFVGAVVFWRALERLAASDRDTRLHAMGVLRELAERAFDDCLGFAFSAPRSGVLPLLRIDADRCTYARITGKEQQL
jgi:hypothetical protein